MGPLKSLAIGLSATTILVWSCNATLLFRDQNVWLATFGLPIVLLSFSIVASLWFVKKRDVTAKLASYSGWRLTMFSLQGAALACWIFDLSTTFYAIDITHVAAEVNPLGWPLGLLGALAYYAPTLTLSYILLFRIREDVAFYAAVPITVVALFMGLMNLHAGTLNLGFFAGAASPAAELGYGFLALILGVGFVFPRLFMRPQPTSASGDIDLKS
jgi:hypothetical protein